MSLLHWNSFLSLLLPTTHNFPKLPSWYHSVVHFNGVPMLDNFCYSSREPQKNSKAGQLFLLLCRGKSSQHCGAKGTKKVATFQFPDLEEKGALWQVKFCAKTKLKVFEPRPKRQEGNWLFPLLTLEVLEVVSSKVILWIDQNRWLIIRLVDHQFSKKPAVPLQLKLRK